MRISRLQIENFRSIRKLDIELPQVCALVGPNNAGKTGILYDEDSSDFQEKRGEEAAFNAQLNSLAKADGSVRVWRLSKNYEDNLRKALGEAKYQQLCQKFSNTGKPTRARLIAMEADLPVPTALPEILRWLANKPLPGAKSI